MSSSDHISSDQVKAARALLRLSVNELAKSSKVSASTIRRWESEVEYNKPNKSTVDKIRAALEAQGIEFLGTADESPGVRLHGRAR